MLKAVDARYAIAHRRRNKHPHGLGDVTLKIGAARQGPQRRIGLRKAQQHLPITANDIDSTARAHFHAGQPLLQPCYRQTGHHRPGKMAILAIPGPRNGQNLGAIFQECLGAANGDRRHAGLGGLQQGLKKIALPQRLRAFA